jgi:hypothetical protein
MPKRTSERKDATEYDELRSAIEQLGQRVEVLTDSVDRIAEELQWRNNERRGEVQFSPPPVTLRSMPADPTAEDWTLNCVTPEQVAELRDSPTTQPSCVSPESRPHDQLCREIADLRQFVAAIILLMSDHYVADLSTEFDWLVQWASQEFDPDILRESLPQCIVTDSESPTEAEQFTGAPATANRSAHQPSLFTGRPDAE